MEEDFLDNNYLDQDEFQIEHESDQENQGPQQMQEQSQGQFLDLLLPNELPKIQPLIALPQGQQALQTPSELIELNQENAICKLCYKYATNAVLCSNQKCGVLFCGSCTEQMLKKHQKRCPFCRVEPFQPMVSPYRSVINNMELKCTLCLQNYKLEEEQKHYKSQCHYFTLLKCKYCQEKLQQKEVVLHTKEKHMDRLDQIIQKMYNRPAGIFDARKVVEGQNEYLNRINKAPKLGTTGKFYCGGRLDGPKCGCCNGFCGPTNGQNCSDCMKLDILRLGLPKGYLVNAQGYACWRQGFTFICNTMKYYQSQQCNEGSPCRRCYQMTKNVQRYAHLL